MQQKITRSGKHSLAVIIPAKFVHYLGIAPGDNVRVRTNLDKGTVNLKFTGAIQLRLPSTKKTK
jgi:antitoxin component of MazEF toxin-antitoxin module